MTTDPIAAWLQPLLDLDAQVVELVAYKVYPNEHTNALNVPGCKIFVVQMI